MRRVILESPWRAPIDRPICTKVHRHEPGPCEDCAIAAWCDTQVEVNREYLRACLRDSLHHGEAPFASHALYAATGAIDDNYPHERELGIQAGLWWGEAADASVIMLDLGTSEGMHRGIREAYSQLRTVEQRYLGGPWKIIHEQRQHEIQLLKEGLIP